MTDRRKAWTPQEVLWELGASFVEASYSAAAEVVESAIERVGELLDAGSAAIWTVDLATMRSERESHWAVNTRSALEESERFVPSAELATVVAECGGFAIVPLEMVVGEEQCRTRGWVDGRAAIGLVEQQGHDAVVLVIGATDSHWAEDELALLQGLTVLLRQFRRRAQVERELNYRLQLDDLLVAFAARLQMAGPGDVDDVVQQVLHEIHDAVGAQTIVLIDIVDDESISLAFLTAARSLPPEWTTIKVPDISGLPGAADVGLRRFVAERRVLDLVETIDAIMGPEVTDAFGFRDSHGTVAVLPASVSQASDAVVAAVRLGGNEWAPEELDAMATVASLIAQTRGRVDAEVASGFRLEVQRRLAAIAKAFLEVDATGAGAAVHDAIGSIGDLLGADLGVVAQLEPGRGPATIVDSWSADGSLAVAPGTTIDRGTSRLIDETLTAETTLRVSEVADDLHPVLQASPDGKWTTVVAPIHGSSPSPAALVFVWAQGRSDDVDAVRDLANASADLIGQLWVRLRAEELVAARLHLDAVMSGIADRFLGASAGEALEVARAMMAELGSHLGLLGLVLRRVEGDESVAEAVWSADGVHGPPLGDRRPLGTTRFDPDANDEPVLVGTDDPVVLEQRWGEGCHPSRAAVIVGSRLDAVLVGIRNDREWLDHELEAFRSLAAMLGQFRGRVAAERRNDRSLAMQRLLSSCTAELAEAGSDDLADVVVSVLGRVGTFAGVDALTVWLSDSRLERYKRLYTWRRGGAAVELADDGLWGEFPTLDAVRISGESLAIVEPDPNAHRASRAAFPRGEAGAVDSIVLALATTPGRWTQQTLELLEALSRTLREVEARVSAQRYADAAFQSAPVGVVVRDEQFAVITCNQAFADFVGAADVDELVGTLPADVLDERFEDIAWETDDEGNLRGEAAFRGRDGVRAWGNMRASAVQGAAGEWLWLIHVEDVTERRRAEQLLRFQASHDELTGLANRRRLLEEVHRIADGSASVAVLLLDLDRFKIINDSLGHDRGDELLVVIADRLRLAVRPGDLVARLGGDEFAVVLPGPVDVSDAAIVADRLLELIGEPVTLGRQKLYPTASVGIAVADDQTAVDDLLRRADTAMYRAKAQGRARHAAFDEKLRDEMVNRMATEAGLRGALRNGELRVHYQPEVSLDDGRFLGAEALVRWQHPERGLLAAGEFIETAEETGLVVEIGEIVLAHACAEAMSWPDGNDAPVVRANLSAAQLQREDTVLLVQSVLSDTGLAPQRLCLEITESAVMHDIGRSEEILHRLKALGVWLAVDDFGTGFSSLAYLKRFPVDALKIDRTFVSGLAEDPEAVAFVRSIISLADALGLDVIAEGVETDEQAQALLDLGCRRAQGFLFAPAGPAEDLRTHMGRRPEGRT